VVGSTVAFKPSGLKKLVSGMEYLQCYSRPLLLHVNNIDAHELQVTCFSCVSEYTSERGLKMPQRPSCNMINLLTVGNVALCGKHFQLP
jgi:hypothetical protein